MNVPAAPALVQVFIRIPGLRGWIAAGFLLLAAAGVYGALQIPTDSAIERLIVADDPDSRAARDFERLFPEGEHALLMLEAPEPLSPAVLRAADHLQRKLAQLQHVQAHSILSFFRRTNPAAELTEDQTSRLRKFATGTTLLRRAGLLGDHYLGIALELQVHSPAERDKALADIDAATQPFAAANGAFTAVRRVGSPWLNEWLEEKTGSASKHVMPLFGIFLITLIFLVFRSWRTLAAIILTLGAAVAIAVGLADLFGWPNTVVSALVPLTVLVTTTATLVYIHARFVDRQDSRPLVEHHARALANKFLPCTASMFATAVGFAALAVSDIRPIRQMGLWTASGLIVAWIACFTLFPALQSLLRTPTRAERAPVGRWYAAFVEVWIPFSGRSRWPLVAAAVLMMLCGAAALFGVPGELAPLALQTDSLAYINPNVAIARDTREFERTNGLTVTQLWLQTPAGDALQPEFLRAVEGLTRRLERAPRRSGADPGDAAGSARVCRPCESCQCARQHSRTGRRLWRPRGDAHVRRECLACAAIAATRVAGRARERGRARRARRSDHAASGPKPDSKLRVDGDGHILRILAGVPQPGRSIDGDDPVVVRDSGRFSPDARHRHHFEYRVDPHRVDRVGCAWK